MLMVNPQWQGWAASDAVSAGAASLARFVGREPDHEVAVPPFHSLHETDGVLGLDEQVRQARDVLETLQRHRPERLVYLAGDCGADAVGANCGAGPENYVKVTRLLAAATDLPIWIKPNAGLPKVDAAGGTTFPMGPDEFASWAPKLAAAGARFIGGCCGTTPDHIRAVCKILRQK